MGQGPAPQRPGSGPQPTSSRPWRTPREHHAWRQPTGGGLGTRSRSAARVRPQKVQPTKLGKAHPPERGAICRLTHVALKTLHNLPPFSSSSSPSAPQTLTPPWGRPLAPLAPTPSHLQAGWKVARTRLSLPHTEWTPGCPLGLAAGRTGCHPQMAGEAAERGR